MECLSQSFFTKYQIYHIKYYIQLISFINPTKALKYLSSFQEFVNMIYTLFGPILLDI